VTENRTLTLRKGILKIPALRRAATTRILQKEIPGIRIPALQRKAPRMTGADPGTGTRLKKL
jgi:hypothetical protein